MEMIKEATPNLNDLYKESREIERLTKENQELKEQLEKKSGTVTDDDFIKGFNGTR